MPITPTPYIWFNGEMVPWEKATVHVMSHALHYGSSVFEGIRCYATPSGPAIFRLGAHIERLFDSARIYYMQTPYSPAEIEQACHTVIAANKLPSAYLRPLIYRGLDELTVLPGERPCEVMIAAQNWGAYLGADAMERGIDVGVSSWARVAPNTLPAMAKAGGNYLSSQLVVMEARRHGYVEGIALDVNGMLSEGSGENLFIVRNGILITPPLTAAILPGITRDAVITLAGHLGIEVREQALPREALYVADELFFTGTAAEISAIRSVDGVTVKSGGRGPVTARLQKAFFGLFTGETPDQWGWLDYPHANS
ncbi:MAG: branched-chain amino acid transaminase [Herpetosiphon sp.]